jgi:hypothetical protein
MSYPEAFMSNIELYDKLIKCGYTDLWLPEMEFLMHDQMEYRKHLWNDTLYMDEMTVFAIDGYGNLFAWRDDDSVVFIDVGPQTCEVFSLNLADAIYRRIIEFSSGDYVEMCSDEEKADMDPDDAEDYISEDDAIALLKQYLDAFRTFFSNEQRSYLERMIQQGFLPETDAFITEEEQLSLVRRLIKTYPSASRKITR